jgi:SAM-dependent methyltransferase
MAEPHNWDDRYQKGETPWDTGKPSAELCRVVAEAGIKPCRAIEFGCGTGINSVWLAHQGFDVTGIDLSPSAIEKARRRAAEAGTNVRFAAADLQQLPPELTGPYDFFFDRGCYHAVRREGAAGYLATLRAVTRPGTLGLVLAGNAREPQDPGPPVVSEAELRSELGSLFDIPDLREFRFNVAYDLTEGNIKAPLAWSCLLRRRDTP